MEVGSIRTSQFVELYRKVVTFSVIVCVVLSSGYYIRNASAADNFVGNNFFNSAITGYWLGSSVSNPLVSFNKPYTEITQFTAASGGRYPIHIYVNQPRNVSDMELYSAQTSAIKDENGNSLYYNWYQILYDFDVIVFSEARSGDLLKTVPFTSDELSWFNFYYWNANEIIGSARRLNNWGTLSAYPRLEANSRSFQISGQVPDPSDPGYTISGNGQSFDYNIPATALTLKVQMMLGGNSIAFPTLVNDTANNGILTFNGTSYHIGSPTLLGTQSGTSSGFVKNNILSVPTHFDVPAVTNYTAEIPKLEKPVLESNTNNYVNTWVGSQDLQLGVEKTMQFTDGFAQTLFDTDRPTAVYDDDTSNVVGIYQPDSRMLPDANTDCYFELPVNFKPIISWIEYQVSYRKLSVWMHRSFQILWWGNELSCQMEEVVDTTYPKTFIESKEVHNMYYIQRVRVPVYVASIYNWKPKSQTGTPVNPPVIPLVDPPKPPKFIGDKNNTLDMTGATDWFGMFLDFIFNPIFGIFMGIVVAVAGFIAYKIFRIFSSPQKLIKRLSKIAKSPAESRKVRVKSETEDAKIVAATSIDDDSFNLVYTISSESTRKYGGLKWLGITVAAVASGFIIWNLLRGGGFV